MQPSVTWLSCCVVTLTEAKANTGGEILGGMKGGVNRGVDPERLGA